MEQYHIQWNTQSENSAGSMPFGGHSIGGNVWVEKNKIYFYLAQSGWFDENNSLLKAGRFSVELEPFPFKDTFRQSLCIEKGYVLLEGDGDFCMKLWIHPLDGVVHMTMSGSAAHRVTARYETWRQFDRVVDHLSDELFQCKEVFFYPQANITFHADTVVPQAHELCFFHRNDNTDLSIHKEARDQGLGQYVEQMENPQKDRIMGGLLDFGCLQYTGIEVGRYLDTPYTAYVYTAEEPLQQWHWQIALAAVQEKNVRRFLERLGSKLKAPATEDTAQQWWQAYFEKSYICIDRKHPGSQPWRIGRNYNLFRFMLGLNASGEWPTKFNGGLLTFDPALVGPNEWKKEALHYTPDYRLWGGGSHTIQNQRLVYWPMLRSGDHETMRQHFDFFLRLLPNVKINVAVHGLGQGAFYPEQVGTYGLCCGCDNEWGNRSGLPVAQIKYHFSNSLETALMMLDWAEYTGNAPEEFLDFIDTILLFYHTFYPENDENGRMILYPANAMETYHVVRNPIDAIAGLTCVLDRLLALQDVGTQEQKTFWQQLRSRIPPLPKTVKAGKQILAAAQTTALIHNCEIPQLYAVHPYNLYGLGKPDLQLAIDTALLAPETEDQLTHISWHPTGVQYARLGLVKQAWDFLVKKLDDGPFRFPAFWGPGHDWTPDHNWGGSGMLQLQEMLLQTDGKTIRLLPCWPKGIDVSFRLFAPDQTEVTCTYEDRSITSLTVTPAARMADVVFPQKAI